ncbi:hypothetical protein HWX16_02095 [Ochrobactrum intermedium]|uniref:DUF6511 domain-containing protein n=1 Tax=Brucella TaxID=234 RepID=UPI00159C29E6|nr:DUF6511 domain-containing protein [Brucella intermedia]NVM39109.1 hypothetical protein [Brucella intermedia]
MIDPTKAEQAAIRSAMKPVAEIMEEIGWQTRLADLSKQQVLTLIEVAVTGYQDALQEYTAANPTVDPEVPF